MDLGAEFRQSQSNASVARKPAPVKIIDLSTAQDKKPEVLRTSPSGAFQIVRAGEEFWVIPTANKEQRSRLHSAEMVIPEAFNFSPDEEWLFVGIHHGSCLSGAELYHAKGERHL